MPRDPTEVPYGYCHCGCGTRTSIATRNHHSRGILKGQPMRFAPRHHAVNGNKGNFREPLATDYVKEDHGHSTPCWIWQGTIQPKTGYGTVKVNYQQHGAHRWYYESYAGPIPAGLQLDHLCRVRACVNPAHLEPVSLAENVLRGDGLSAVNARKTHCLQGHPFDGANTYVDRAGKRHCRACKAARQRQYVARRSA